MKPGTKRQAPSAETGLAAANQNPEQLARDGIDAKLLEAGWSVQTKATLNFGAGPGIAVREYQTDQTSRWSHRSQAPGLGPQNHQNLEPPARIELATS